MLIHFFFSRYIPIFGTSIQKINILYKHYLNAGSFFNYIPLKCNIRIKLR